MTPPPSALYVGLMSGTSADGVDAALVDLSSAAARLLATHFLPFDDALRAEILALNGLGADELGRAALLSNALAERYATAVSAVLGKAGIGAAALAAVGCHGQTVRHRPALGYTIQLVNGALLAERIGATVVTDFRSRDIAAAGQGAPLAPAFHAACLRDSARHRVIANIGGFANLTDLPPQGPVRGFDTGPGNALLDLWATQHLGERFDRDGDWAASGSPDPALLDAMLRDPFFSLAPPKSTGRDHFTHAWLQGFAVARLRPEDVQATLTALTARSIAEAVDRHCGPAIELLVCGGGVHNRTLMAQLAAALPGRRVANTAELGIDPDWVEAMAFAWIAHRTLCGEAGNLPEVTGAAGPRILGAIYPA